MEDMEVGWGGNEVDERGRGGMLERTVEWRSEEEEDSGEVGGERSDTEQEGNGRKRKEVDNENAASCSTGC